MSQQYKAVYFSDMPADSSKQKSLTLAFGSKSAEIFDALKDLTSEQIRQLIGSESYEGILDEAQKEDLPLNRYCIRQIKDSLNSIKEPVAQYALAGIPAHERLFDPLSVTFRGGAQEPFVRWYPYLEGYSSTFVQEIIGKYVPDAKAILDPFAGTGTTAFTAAHMNIKAYYCEINPVLQFVCSTKIRVRRLKAFERQNLAQELLEYREYLLNYDSYEPDNRLNTSYKKCFGFSQFFDETTYDEVLRVRSWIDAVNLRKPLLADLLMVATLSALVPASKMKRNGDLRYKTASESRVQNESLLKKIDIGIGQIIADIRPDSNGLQIEPVMIAENAWSLVNIPKLNLDGVITSPPYVNGTNYFRNTKIELWFLRCLNDKEDLAKYRFQALTAGINDVTVGKAQTSDNPEVKAVVEMLKKNAYDVRIPKMISSYFSEINEIFGHISRHLKSKAIIAIDIGDTCYGGIHVPVDTLLSSCFRNLGFVEKDVTELRQRRSKGGEVLKQVLLVYEYQPEKACESITEIPPQWSSGWESFKTEILHQQPEYAKRNWGHPLHSLCSYQGKMKPAIAHHLVNAFVPEGGKMLDPFAGVGTIPFEAALQGKMAYGFEISPAAFAISSGKTQKHNLENCNEVIENLRIYLRDNRATPEELEDSRQFGFNGKLADYYHPETLNEILLARRFFNGKVNQSPEESFVIASLLHILHGNRPYALSRWSHPITPYKPTGVTEYRSLIGLLQQKVNRGMKEDLPSNFKPSKILLQDATAWWPKEVDGLDAVITSPPFYDSTRFYLSNWIRLWFCGWNPLDFDGRPLGFVEERQKTSFDVYVPILRQAKERLKPGGVMVLHLGKSVKCDMSEKLAELGKNWFSHSEKFEESVSHCESHGIRDKGTVTAHQYLVLY